MMEDSRPAEENIITDVRYLFRLKKKLNCTSVKDIRNLFGLDNKPKVIVTKTKQYLLNNSLIKLFSV